MDWVTNYLRLAGRVIRYHAWPTIQTQTVGEHSWQVALVYEQIFGPLSPPVERFIRLHDVAELVLGDIPFPQKSLNPGLKAEFDRAEHKALEKLLVWPLDDLSEIERVRVKVCDLLEMMLFGMDERELGSLHALPIIIRTCQAALDKTADLPDNERQFVFRFIDKAHSRHKLVLSQPTGRDY
jgi:5'-deoxynucleotidase YfbR-like HD superfamily hydrolase